MLNNNRLPNQAHFEFDGDKNNGECEVILNRREIINLHGVADNPQAQYDISIVDRGGNTQIEKKGCHNPTGRWGERISKKLSDSYYTVRVENARGVKSLDIFCE